MRGEITLTGGRNPFLPLLRYRTDDFASLEYINGHRILVGLEGREPVEYRNSADRVIHSMEVTRLMRRYPVLRYEMLQQPTRQWELVYEGAVNINDLRQEIEALFGEPVIVTRN